MTEVCIRWKRLVSYKALSGLLSTRDEPVSSSSGKQSSVLQCRNGGVLERARIPVRVQVDYRVLTLLLPHEFVRISEVVRDILKFLLLMLAVKLYRFDRRLGYVICNNINGNFCLSISGVLLDILVVVCFPLYVFAHIRALHFLSVPQCAQTRRR